MKNSENNLKCRLATHGEYSQIMSIDDNIYGGYDYLAHLYHSYLEKESLICSVGELNSNCKWSQVRIQDLVKGEPSF